MEYYYSTDSEPLNNGSNRTATDTAKYAESCRAGHLEMGQFIAEMNVIAILLLFCSSSLSETLNCDEWQ